MLLLKFHKCLLPPPIQPPSLFLSPPFLKNFFFVLTPHAFSRVAVTHAIELLSTAPALFFTWEEASVGFVVHDAPGAYMRNVDSSAPCPVCSARETLRRTWGSQLCILAKEPETHVYHFFFYPAAFLLLLLWCRVFPFTSATLSDFTARVHLRIARERPVVL